MGMVVRLGYIPGPQRRRRLDIDDDSHEDEVQLSDNMERGRKGYDVVQEIDLVM